jgi:hypothetical protein
MRFSPPAPTRMRATPLGTECTLLVQRQSMPSALRLATASRPKRSSPTAPTNATFVPAERARAAATAWLAPLPPAAT